MSVAVLHLDGEDGVRRGATTGTVSLSEGRYGPINDTLPTRGRSSIIIFLALIRGPVGAAPRRSVL